MIEMPVKSGTPLIDAYIAKAQPLAQPILTHVRNLVHQACPEVEEEIKWGCPFYLYRGAILCSMAAFKAHCKFQFWDKQIRATVNEPVLDHITSVDELPSDKKMLGWMRSAVASIESGQYTSMMAERPRKAQPEASELPSEFATALQKDKKAAAAFNAMSTSCQREYAEWIAEAKRAETREKRIATALEWIAEGKSRNWKYQ